MNPKFTYLNIKSYVIENTGLLLASTPIGALNDMVFGVSISKSLESKLKVIGGAYLGLGFIYVKGRDFSRKMFKMNKEGVSEKKKFAHDAIYNVCWSVPFSLAIYLSSGVDFETAKNVTISANIISFFSGPITGYTIDMFRDFAGFKKSDRKIPLVLKNTSKKTKKVLATGMLAASILLTAGVYTVKHNYFPKKYKQEKIIEVSKQKNLEYLANHYQQQPI